MGPCGSHGEHHDRFFSTGLVTIEQDGNDGVLREYWIKILPAMFRD